MYHPFALQFLIISDHISIIERCHLPPCVFFRTHVGKILRVVKTLDISNAKMVLQATRGLKVALVERDDFASGTSSRSTKLIHGGIRYLAQAFQKEIPPKTLLDVFKVVNHTL